MTEKIDMSKIRSTPVVQTKDAVWSADRIFWSPDIRPPFRELIKHFEHELGLIHAKRKARGLIFRAEMEEFLALINWERAQLDKDPVPMRLLLRREQGAQGHSDYAHKLALYGAEIVLDQDTGP